MPITADSELPIRFDPILGPGVDALENRKECGSTIDLEGTIKLPPKDWFVRAAEFFNALKLKS